MSNRINREELSQKIEPHFSESLADREYEVVSEKASRFLTYNRLDIAIKALFLEFLDERPDFSEALYATHLKCFTLGSFREPGNPQKDSLRRYIEEFEAIYQSIGENGFDATQTLVPLGKEGTILNGAHRVCSALVSGKNVVAVKLPIPDPMYDYRFFLNRGMSKEQVEAAVSKFAEMQPNCYVACVWPRAKGKEAELEALFTKVVYQKSVKLSYRGAHNILAEVYAGESWIGSPETGYAGVKGKLVECFPGDGELRVYVFQSESLDDVVKLKGQIRALFGVGKHSVHITDTHEEAKRLSRLLFNANSLHFLEFGAPYTFKETHGQLELFSSVLAGAGVARTDAMLDSSIVLALYGIRKARDLDYLSVRSLGQTPPQVEAHDSELKFHSKKKVDLLFDSRCFFYFRDTKIISLSQLAEMKGRRLEEKDVRDLKMMAPYLSKDRMGPVRAMNQKLLFFRAQLRRRIMLALKKVGLYKFAKTAYRLIRGRRGG